MKWYKVDDKKKPEIGEQVITINIYSGFGVHRYENKNGIYGFYNCYSQWIGADEDVTHWTKIDKPKN